MNKVIIVINGKGGCGKDTLCEVAATKYNVLNVSSISPIKEMARIVGWNGGKTPEDRKFLADIKKIVTEYNDAPNNYLLEKAKFFAASTDFDVMFVHIREPEMIDHFKETVKTVAKIDVPVRTLIVRRPAQQYLVYGNESDDAVDQYDYDFVYENDTEPEKIKDHFIPLLETIMNY